MTRIASSSGAGFPDGHAALTRFSLVHPPRAGVHQTISTIKGGSKNPVREDIEGQISERSCVMHETKVDEAIYHGIIVRQLYNVSGLHRGDQL